MKPKKYLTDKHTLLIVGDGGLMLKVRKHDFLVEKVDSNTNKKYNIYIIL
jgi:hypothetical protein